jgi:hypothetical protein
MWGKVNDADVKIRSTDKNDNIFSQKIILFTQPRKMPVIFTNIIVHILIDIYIQIQFFR